MTTQQDQVNQIIAYIQSKAAGVDVFGPRGGLIEHAYYYRAGLLEATRIICENTNNHKFVWTSANIPYDFPTEEKNICEICGQPNMAVYRKIGDRYYNQDLREVDENGNRIEQKGE